MTTLNRNQLLFLLSACEYCFGNAFEDRLHEMDTRERAGDFYMDGRPFPVKALAVRMGMTEAAGTAIANELCRHAFAYRDCADYWIVTADGAAEAARYKSQTRSGLRLREDDFRESAGSRMTCTSCLAVVTEAQAYCGRCGRQRGSTRRVGATLPLLTILAFASFILGIAFSRWVR